MALGTLLQTPQIICELQLGPKARNNKQIKSVAWLWMYFKSSFFKALSTAVLVVARVLAY